jgi:hypothetical protein
VWLRAEVFRFIPDRFGAPHMNENPTTEPFWRRGEPPKNRDIALLKPPSLDKRKRFETVADAAAESLRSEWVLKSANRGSLPQQYLCECRSGYYRCGKTYCPICARKFRRWFIGQTLRIVDQYPGHSRVMTVLLAKASHIHDLDAFDCKSPRCKQRYHVWLPHVLHNAGDGRVRF